MYYLGKKIKGADVQTFEVMGLYRAKDGKGGVFFEGQSEKDAPDLDDLFEDEK